MTPYGEKTAEVMAEVAVCQEGRCALWKTSVRKCGFRTDMDTLLD